MSAKEEAEELLPCFGEVYMERRGKCSSIPGVSHDPICPGLYRPAVAQRMREIVEARDKRIAELENIIPECGHCGGKPAVCFGAYEGSTADFACNDCCGHGCEDGSCTPIGDLGHGIVALEHQLEELRAELAAFQADIEAIKQGMRVEFGGLDSGDVVADFGVFLEHHKKKEAELASWVALEAALKAQPEPINSPWDKPCEHRVLEGWCQGCVTKLGRDYDALRHENKELWAAVEKLKCASSAVLDGWKHTHCTPEHYELLIKLAAARACAELMKAKDSE